MICRHCGIEINENALFCPYCGQKVKKNAIESDSWAFDNDILDDASYEKESKTVPSFADDLDEEKTVRVDAKESEIKQKPPKEAIEEPPQIDYEKPSSKKTIRKEVKFGIVAMAMLIAFVGIILTIKRHRVPVINLNDYITIDVSGENGSGHADAIFDKYRFVADFAERVDLKDGSDSKTIARELGELVFCGRFSQQDGLSNGDIIKYHWRFNEKQLEKEYHVNLVFVDETKNVSGLSESIQSTPQDATFTNKTDEQILPQSSQQLLTEEDIAGLDDYQLLMAAYEIYARKGYVFDDPTCLDYFMRRSWYNPSIKAEKFTENMLSQTEKQNIEFLNSHRSS